MEPLIVYEIDVLIEYEFSLNIHFFKSTNLVHMHLHIYI